jgi:hypothetical protein
MTEEIANAEVVAVYPNKVRVAVDDLLNFQAAGESLRVGSFLKVSDNDNVSLICIIESFSIEMKEVKGGGSSDYKRVYMIDAYPLGPLKTGSSIAAVTNSPFRQRRSSRRRKRKSQPSMQTAMRLKTAFAFLH